MALSGTLKTNTYNYGGDVGPRGLQFVWTATQSITGNYSDISYTLSGFGGNSGYYKTGPIYLKLDGKELYSSTTRIELRNTTVVKSGSFRITHNSTGAASFKIDIEAAVYKGSVNCTASGTFTLDNIARKSTLAVQNGTLGAAMALTVTRQASTLTHSIKITCGSAAAVWLKADGTTSGTETKLTETSLTYTPPLSLASQNKTGTSVGITFTIYTYSGTTALGSTPYPVSAAIPASVKPTASIAVSDAAGYSGTYGYLQTLSKIRVKTTAAGAGGSTISSINVTVNAWKFTGEDITTPVLPSAGTYAITVTVTDSRGRTATATQQISCSAYAPPKVDSVALVRADSAGQNASSGEYGRVTFSGGVTSLGGKNTASYAILRRLRGATDWETLQIPALDNQTAVTDAVALFPADPNYAYECVVKITDAFGARESTRLILASSFVLVQATADGTGLSIGGPAVKPRTLQVYMPAHFDGDVTGQVIGLANLPVIPAGADLNECRNPGAYAAPFNSSQSPLRNCPAAIAGTLRVSAAIGVFTEGGDVMLRQVFIPYDCSAVYQRLISSTGGNWSFAAWKKITFTAV